MDTPSWEHARTEESATAKRLEPTDWSEEEWVAWRAWSGWNQSNCGGVAPLTKSGGDVAHAEAEAAANNEQANEQPQNEPKESEASLDGLTEGLLDGLTQGVDGPLYPNGIAARTAVADVRSIPATRVDLPVKAPQPLQVPPPPPPPTQPLKENTPPPPPPPSLPLTKNAPPPNSYPSSQASLTSLPPLPPQTRPTSPPPATSHALPAASPQPAPQSRSFADGDATETRPERPMRVPPDDWNLTLDRIAGAKVFDARFYKALFAERRAHNTFKQHNGAAKWLRKVLDDGGHHFLVLENASAVAVKNVIHHKGMQFGFLDEEVHWIWHEMIGQLDDASIDEVCKSPLVQCDFAFRGKQKGPGGDLVWDFRVHRQDGTMMTLHPDWSRRTFQAREFGDERDGHDELAAVGTFGADGKKCKLFRKSLGSIKLHFDPQKEPSNRA